MKRAGAPATIATGTRREAVTHFDFAWGPAPGRLAVDAMTVNDPKDPKQKREAKDAKRSEAEKKIREAAHDHTIAESMVASDPPSSIPDPQDEDALDERPPVREEKERREEEERRQEEERK